MNAYLERFTISELERRLYIENIPIGKLIINAIDAGLSNIHEIKSLSDALVAAEKNVETLKEEVEKLQFEAGMIAKEGSPVYPELTPIPSIREGTSFVEGYSDKI